MQCLRIAVVGGGIAGLSVAAFLAQTGITCTVYERADPPREAGAGIQLGPNATRLLRGVGLDGYLADNAIRPEAIEVRHWRTGGTVERIELGRACEAAYGAPYHTVRRSTLHAGLLDLVTTAGCVVRSGRRCVGLVEGPDEVELRFADGSRIPADLVVGADGIGSVVRRTIADDRTSFCGLVAYRALVPVGHVPGTPSTPMVRVWLGPDRHVVYYPVCGGIVNVVVVRPGDATPATPVTTDVADGFAGWHPSLRRVLRAIGPATRWPLYERTPLARWCTRRVALAGDAAHPLLPFGAQGANQAVEDAATLVACLSAANGAIPEALAGYERVRIPRLARIAALVRDVTISHHLGNDVPVPLAGVTPDARASLRERAWLYGYDVERAVHAVGHGSGRDALPVLRGAA